MCWGARTHLPKRLCGSGFPREGSRAEGEGDGRWQLSYSALHLALENGTHLAACLCFHALPRASGVVGGTSET